MNIPILDSNFVNLMELLFAAATFLTAVINLIYDITRGLSEKKKTEETTTEPNYTYEIGLKNIPDDLSQEEKDSSQQFPKG